MTASTPHIAVVDDHPQIRELLVATNAIYAPVSGATPITVNAGTLVLGGTNTSIGTITINSGTLQIGSSGSSGSVAAPTIVNNSSLTLNRGDTATIASAINGSGTLTKIGVGTFILSGTNTYSGLTTVSEGTLQVGTGTTGSITGNVETNANLQLTRTDNTTFSNTVSGTGTLTKAGTGTLTLTGTNSFSGGLVLQNGNLIAGEANIGSGTVTFPANANATVWQVTGSSDNDIAFLDGATGNKVINLATGVTDVTLSGTITISDASTTFSTSRINPIGGTIVITGKITGTGSGGLAKRNTGTVIITNSTNDYTGPTNIVDAGTLIVNGKVPGDVNFGENLDGTGGPAGTNTGFLAGSGTVGGNVKLQGGSRIAPGGTSSAGVTTPTAAVLSIGGNLNLSLTGAGTGGLVMDLGAPTGPNDRVAVGGTVDIGTNFFGLSELFINNLGGLAAGSYTLVSSAGIIGAVNPSNNSGLIAPGFNGTLSVSGNDLVLTVTSTANPYQTWAASFPTLSNPAFGFDFDNDGIASGLEWILGGNPTIADTASILPTVTGSSASGLTLNFKREEDSIGVANLVVEYGTTLSVFPGSAVIGAASSGPDGNGVTINVNSAPDPDQVTVTIPASNAVGGRLFARLRAVLP